MTWDGVPWMVGGGAEHGAEIGRLLAYAAVGGAEGIVGVGDLKVTAQTVPGASVKHTAGAAILLNRSVGGDQQVYMGRSPSEVNPIAIGATGGAGRSDLIVVRVEDPQYSPWGAPPDVESGPYIYTRVISGVPSTTKTAAELNLGYAAIALARIDIPVSTATITDAMITDLRKVARPRTQRELLTAQQVTDNDLTSGTFVTWPAVATWSVDIPSWATKAKIIATVAGAQTQNSAQAYGKIKVVLDTLSTQQFTYDENWLGVQRKQVYVADTLAIPSGIRGTTVTVKIQATRDIAQGAGYLQADAATAAALDIQFVETAE